MTNDRQSDAAAEWAATQGALEDAYKLLDAATERERKDRDDQGKLIDTIRSQASALARLSADKSVFRRVLEYSVLLVILALAAELLYLGYQLQALLR